MPGRTINNVAGSRSRKRTRRDSEDGSNQEELVDVREASSGLRSEDVRDSALNTNGSLITNNPLQRRKRARISKSKQPEQARVDREASDSSSAEEDDVHMEEPGGHLDLAATQYDLLRDAGFKHLDHAEEDDKRATQRLQRKGLSRQSNRAGAVTNYGADNGILESIQCVNFMCHDNLRVELGPNMNFIVGENGSGKSAVLTAITLCLGGKASSTNRGGSLKSFIKEGRDKSKLIVKIKNKGRDAYQHETYGDAILVERHFSRAGSSGFSVKSDTGRTISTKKRDVDEIVEYYCLQVDNPLNVLSQDNARQFLNAASAKQKYRFFLQGVQLQQLDDDFRVIEEYLNANEHKEGDLQTKVEVSHKEYDKAKREFELLQESSEIRDQLKLLSQKAVWSQVIDKERELADHDRLLGEADQSIGDIQAVIDARTEAFNRIEQEIAQHKQEVDILTEEHSRLSAKKDEAKEARNTAKAQNAGLQTDQRDARSRLQNAEKECKQLEAKIKEEQGRLEEATGAAITQKNEELQATKAKLHQTTEKIEEEKKREPDLTAKFNQAIAELKTVEQNISQKQNDIQITKKRISQIEVGQGSLYEAYEPQMQRLLQMIEADAGFEKRPVGPIGAQIQVLQPMWSPMLERTFGEALNGFVVTSKRDQLRLSGMMNRLGMKRSPVFIGSARPIDTSGSEPDELYTTILRILKIEDPLIRNQLIITNRIEKTILVQTKDDADHIMLDSAPPRNVIACCHPLQSRGHGWTVRLTVNANGVNSSPQAPPVGGQKPRLQSDSHQEKTLHEDRLRQLQGELRDLQNQKNQQQQSCERCKQEIKECKKSVEKLGQEKRTILAEIEVIQGELDAFDGVDGRLEGYRENLKTAQEDLERYSSEYGTIGLRRDEKISQCEQLHNAWKAEEQNFNEADARLKEAQAKVQRAEDSRTIALTAKNQAFDEHQLAKIRKQRLEDKRAALQETVTAWTEKALQVCERVSIWESESYTVIEKKLSSLKKTLEERERRRGMTDEEVTQRAQQAKAAHESLRRAYEQVCKENRSLKTTLQKRLDRWRSFQRYISSTSRSNFMYLLSERDYRGKLILDHRNHTLEVQVEPDKTKAKAAARSTKTLSGGEKSFSSICLLLAIWEAMGSPLRCLDEFDVFMDNVNRRMSTNMLVSPPPHLESESRI